MKQKSNKKGPVTKKRAVTGVPASPVGVNRLFSTVRERHAVLLGLFLFLLVLGVFYPITHGDFINYDDDVYVTDNFHVQSGLGLEQIAWAFDNTDAANWHPLTWLSHMLDCQFYGPKPWGHHLTSVLLHAVNTALLFLAMCGMTRAVWRSLFVALLFGLHPLRVESVAWIAERKDVLCATFWMLALWAYGKYARESKGPAKVTGAKPKVYYGLTLVCFVLGLMSKPMVVTLPFVLLLLDYWPLDRMKNGNVPRLIWEKTPFLLLAAAGSVINFLAQKNHGAITDILPLGYRLENAVLAYGRYLGKFLYPADLAILYPHPLVWPIAKVAAAAALFLTLSLAAIITRRSHPYCLVGWLWFVGTLVPVIGLVQVGSQAMADRYTYLPGIGLSILLAWGVCDLAKRLRVKRTALAAAATAAALGCAALTRHQIGFWRDSGTVFGHAVAVTENSYQARKALGDFYWTQGRANEAMDLYRQAIQMHPEFEGAHLNLGAVLNQTGRVDEAIDEFRRAIALKPDDASAYNDLGAVLGDGRLDESMSLFQKAIEIDPNYADAHKNLGQALDQKGLLEKAVTEYQAAARLKSGYYAHYLLGMDLERLGRKDEAIVQFTQALKFRADGGKAQIELERLQK